MTGAWPGWRKFLRGTWTVARTGGGVRAVVADLVAGFRWWLRPSPVPRWEFRGEDGPELDVPPVRFTYVRVLAEDFPRDGYFCECGRQRLHNEDIRP